MDRNDPLIQCLCNCHKIGVVIDPTHINVKVLIGKLLVVAVTCVSTSVVLFINLKH